MRAGANWGFTSVEAAFSCRDCPPSMPLCRSILKLCPHQDFLQFLSLHRNLLSETPLASSYVCLCLQAVFRAAKLAATKSFQPCLSCNYAVSAVCTCAPQQAELADQVWQQQTKEALLKEQPAWPAIDRLDQQLKQVQQQCDKAREFIRSHEERSNYTPLVPQLAELIDATNAANIAAVTA